MSRVDVKSIYYTPDKNSLAAVRSGASNPRRHQHLRYKQILFPIVISNSICKLKIQLILPIYICLTQNITYFLIDILFKKFFLRYSITSSVNILGGKSYGKKFVGFFPLHLTGKKRHELFPTPNKIFFL